MNLLGALILSFILGVFLDLFIAKISRKNPKKVIHFIKTKKYIIHHSILGVIFCIIGIFLEIFILLGLGLGIILSHSIREKSLLFVESSKKG